MAARKHKHQEHLNHEAWAIPYGDLVTLLLAFFMVMYSISSVNEGKYRTVSASLTSAFRGVPTTPRPIQLSENTATASDSALDSGQADSVTPEQDVKGPAEEIESIAGELEGALTDLIEQEIVVVRGTPLWLEVELQTDILFNSGEARLSDKANSILSRLAAALQGFDNPIRVEGHTDNVPISTDVYPSNWELSAARAASVVHLLMKQGVDPMRLSVIGLGEYRPAENNTSEDGRNRNRRVLMVIPSSEQLRKTMQEKPIVRKPLSASPEMNADGSSVSHPIERQ